MPLLYRLIDPTEEFKALDVIFIEGDFFDSLMPMNHPDMLRIISWIVTLLQRCKKYNILLRVLEGTPSHDMKQNRWFIYLNGVSGIGADVKYFDDLAIEKNEKLGVNILYLPDEWDSPLENCFIAAKQLIKENGLEKVDYALMHGNFEYQLPKVAGLSSFSSAMWQTLVFFAILVGHVHNASTYGLIRASGSFNRLRHGEESPKGYSSVVGYADGRSVIKFIENKDAKTYLTVKIPESPTVTTDELIEFVTNTCKDLRPDSYIKFAGKSKVKIDSIVNYAKSEYPDINFSTKQLEDESENKIQSILPDIKYNKVGVDITRHNSSKLLLDELKRRGFDTDFINQASSMLKDVIDEL